MANSLAHEVELRAQAALARSPIHAIRSLRVEQQGESLVMTGRLESFYYKQLAQELVRAVASDYQLINSIEVD